MIDREEIQGLLKSRLPEANDEMLGHLADEAERELEIRAREVVRKILENQERVTLLRVDVKA